MSDTARLRSAEDRLNAAEAEQRLIEHQGETLHAMLTMMEAHSETLAAIAALRLKDDDLTITSLNTALTRVSEAFVTAKAVITTVKARTAVLAAEVASIKADLNG